MIDWLSIRHFAIASAVELEFNNGFSAVTGETGSGKSLMVDALSVLLGARADASLIQHGQDSAEIQCQFSLEPDHPVFGWLSDNDLDSEQELVLRRVIRRDRPGRGYINGRSVNIGTLREVGNALADIHGQHDHHSLMRRAVQQQLLDESAGNGKLLVQIGDLYDEVVSLEKQRDALTREQTNTRERVELLTFQLNELERLNPQPGEWDKLDLSQKRLQHIHELASGAQSIASRLQQGDNDINSELVRLAGQLRQLQQFDPKLAAVAELLEESSVNLEEAASELNSRYQDVDVDEAEVSRIDARISTFHELGRKHRIEPQQLAEHAAAMRRELDSLSNPEAEAERLDELIREGRKAYRKVADKLGKLRRKSSVVLGRKITAAMQELGMQGGSFDIRLTNNPELRLSRTGNETVEFLVTANAGQPLQPLSRIASGGEVSRISLAIQVILAGTAKVPTLIFDEVDVGIGGTVANVVGARLHELGQSSQVICVTHLAQVAARADHHYSVAKASSSKKVDAINVSVNRLDHEQRIEEIARMTGSEKLTKQARDHAEQMLAAG